MKALFTVFMLLLAYYSQAQDVLIKTDKSEINAKVIEITGSDIKYKKWENLEGPIYNIGKSAVFMIIYANGQREIISEAGAAAVDKSNSSLAPALAVATSTTVDADTKKDHVRYAPTRFLYWLEETSAIGFQQELRVVKNICNFGVGYRLFLNRWLFANFIQHLSFALPAAKPANG